MNAESISLNCNGRLLYSESPMIMGILNVNRDSFYDGGKYLTEKDWLRQSEKILSEGAAIIDTGVVSTRPGAEAISADEEIRRLLPVIDSIKKTFPFSLLSVDTYRSDVARAAAEHGADMINDISGGSMDDKMFETIPDLKLPYILMHIQRTPYDMQHAPVYKNVVKEVSAFLFNAAAMLRERGVQDIVIDPGFGFGKTSDHNFEMLRNLRVFKTAACPVLVGVSRKSMIYRNLNITPNEALNGTTALHMAALMQGADILRVHDVKEAAETILLWKLINKSGKSMRPDQQPGNQTVIK